MKREHLQLGELAARTTPVWVIINGKVDLTTLYAHVMKSTQDDSLPYAFVRDRLFLLDLSRDTMYYMRYQQAADALFLTEGQAKDL